MKILLTLSYVGTSYCGYQLQPDKPTVAAELNKATEKAFGFKCNVTGCSRTDSGVHALGYRATIEPCDADNKITVPLERIPVAINCHLPQDIAPERYLPPDGHCTLHVTNTYGLRLHPIWRDDHM